MELPKRITPCPIIDSIIEIRFESTVPDEAAFGLFYPQLKEDYPKFVKLPVAQMPEVFRQKDPNLRYSPYYQSKSGPFVLRFGPRVFSLSNPGDYVGWEKYFNEFKKLFEKVRKLDFFNGVIRVGVRYIDRFEFDIFPRIEIDILVNNTKLGEIPKSFACVTETDGLSLNLQVGNNVDFFLDESHSKGSIIDIDSSFLSLDEKLDQNKLLGLVENCHSIGKKRFFSLLKKDFLESLNPENFEGGVE